MDYCEPHAKMVKRGEAAKILHEGKKEKRVGDHVIQVPDKQYLTASAEHPAPDHVKPLCKWAGAKGWFAKQHGPVIADYLDKTGGHYVEPFLGSASVALWLNRPKMVLTDVLAPLVEFYEVVRDSPGDLAFALSATAIPGVDKPAYLRVRDSRPDTKIGRAARFFYLNRVGFNGLYRENKDGEFNVPWGDAVYRRSVVERVGRDSIESLFPNRERIELVSRVFQQAELGRHDFESVIDCAGWGDLTYVDPPYDGTFASYSSGGFTHGDQERLAAALRRARERGAVIIAHNALTDRVKELYAWADITEVAEKRSIAARGSRRGRAASVIITSGLPDRLVV